jgi:hypothetical protein
VAPVFDRLAAGDPHEWLPRLLALPRRDDGIAPALPSTLSAPFCLAWQGHCGVREKRLEPSTTLLRWLIDHGPLVRPPKDLGTRDSVKREKRRRLFAGDPLAREQARAALECAGFVEHEWYVFEGRTSVDAYIKTAELIVLIEGKRTERGPTTRTSWMPVRHQMLRNIDDVWDEPGRKAVVGFFIVEGRRNELEVPPRWRQAVREAVGAAALAGSLPHRSPDERDEIARAFAGATTWQRVCSEFGIAWSEIRDLEVRHG